MLSRMSVQNQYDNNGYKNWLRACLGLKYLKEGILDFVDAEVKQLHSTIITSVCGSRSCSRCPTEYLTKKRHKCPNNICDLIRQKIEQSHRFGRPCWQNTDATKWCTDYWEIGKCFMSPGYATQSTAAETDCSGLLSVCINGLFLPAALTGQIIPPPYPGAPPADIFHKNREARNALLYSGSTSLSDDERQVYIQDMISLLTTYKMPIDQVTHNAINKLTQLNANIFITSDVLKTKLEAIPDASVNLDALNTQTDSNQTAIQRAEGAIDETKYKIANTSSEVETQWQLQKIDTSVIEAQIKNNIELIASVRDNLGRLQSKLDEMKPECKALGAMNANPCIEMADLKLRTQVQYRSNDARLGKAEDEIAELRKYVNATRETICPANTAQDKEHTVKDIKDYLVAKYKRDELTVPMSPLLHRISANVDDVYVEQTIRNDLIHKPRDQMKNKSWLEVGEQARLFEKLRNTGLTEDSIGCYKDVLYDGNISCKNIYIVGKAGVGKTTWSRKFVATWVRAMESKGTLNVPNENEAFLQEYNLVFYISLRNARGDTHITEMIDHQLFLGAPDLFALAKTLLNTSDDSSRCIVLLDGLDEWFSQDNLSSTDGLPLRDPRWKPAIITTTRAWKLQALQLEAAKIDRAVEIQDLQQSGVDKLIARVVSTLNKNTGANKNPTDFKAPANSSIRDCLRIPLLLTISVCLWYETNEISTHLAGLYNGLVTMLIQYTEGNKRVRLFQKIMPRKLNEMKEKWRKELCSVPQSLTSNTLLVSYLPFLQRLGKLAFDALFAESKELTLVFDYRSIKNVLPEDELDLAVNIGLLSQTMQPESVLEQQCTLSFLHKTIQEFLATLYIASGDHKSGCLSTYNTYCANSSHRILEMENVLLFLSGLCPEMAAEIQCHTVSLLGADIQVHKQIHPEMIKHMECFADIEQNEQVRKLLLHCFREEQAMSAYHNATSNNADLLYGIAIENIPDSYDCIREPRETQSQMGVHDNNSSNESELNTCTVVKKLVYTLSSGTNDIPPDSLNKAIICHYIPDADSKSDTSGCKVLRTVQYQLGCRALEIQTEILKEIQLLCCSSNAELVLDMSGCKVLKKLECTSSSVAIRLPTESLEEVEIQSYNPSTESVLDMSGCGVLKKLSYKMSTGAIRLPTESLEEVKIHGYIPSTESVLDMSGCRVLKKLSYTLSTGAIRLPTESLEEVKILRYIPSTESVLDLSGCKVLRKLSYMCSTAAIRLPTESLEEIEIQSYSTESVLDLSGCRVLKKLSYMCSTAAIRLPTESLEEIEIQSYSTESVLDMSGCGVLRKLSYNGSAAAIRLPTESLEQVGIHGYIPSTESVLDMSGRVVFRKLKYSEISATILLLTESLEEIEIQDYSPSTESVLDISGCRVLKKLSYWNSTAAIRLPTESLEEVEIQSYSPSIEAVLDISGCRALRKLSYALSTGAIRLPTESLEEVEIQSYSTESVLDISGCGVLRKLKYSESSAALRLPTESLEDIEIQSYRPITESVLDMSACSVLRKLECALSTTAIRLPTESLEEVVINNYNPDSEEVLDMSGCRVLRKLKLTSSSTIIRLPTESLEEVVIDNYTTNHEPVLDMSGCSVLRHLECTLSTTAIRLPTESLEEVVINNYNPDSEEVLDMSGCRFLRKLKLTSSTAPIQLPTESLEEVVIHGYRPRMEPMLDMSGCKVLREIEYTSSSIEIRLPTESLEHVAIRGYNPSTKSVLDMSGCRVLRKLEYTWSSVGIQLPIASLEEIVTYKDNPNTESELDMSGCKLRYHGPSSAIRGAHTHELIEMTNDQDVTCGATQREDSATGKAQQIQVDPNPDDLNRALKKMGRKSSDLKRKCLKICNRIKSSSKHIKRVWPGYMPTTKENADDSVIFVVVRDTPDTVPRKYGYVMGFKALFCKEDDCNNEEVIVNNSQERKNKPFTAEEMGLSRGENMHRLITLLTSSHSNINCVMFSSVKSKNFEEGAIPNISRETCVVIYVHVKGIIPLSEEAFPKNLGGFPVDVREGVTQLCGGGPYDFHHALKMGCAVTRGQMGENLTFGTIGAFVDRNGEQFCLTSAHVIASSSEMKEAEIADGPTEFSSPSVPVYQPPKVPKETSDQFGELRELIYDSGVESGVGIEIALLKINSRFPESGQFPDEGNFESAGFNESQKMEFNSGEVEQDSGSTQEVVKYGCSTKVTKGQLGMGGVYFKKEMVGFTLELHGQTVVQSGTPDKFADGGDSGALVFDSRNKKELRPVGMIVGDMKGSTFITPISKIMTKLGVKTFKHFAVSGPAGGAEQCCESATNLKRQTTNGKKNKMDSAPAFASENSDQSQRIGNITISLQKELGRGAKSVVFGGSRDDGLAMAVKRLAFSSETEKLKREKRIHSDLEQCRHKNIVGYYGSEIVSNYLYIYLELCQGTLFDYVKEEQQEWRLSYPPSKVNNDMARGLEYLHSKNLAHRDLSPGNVLFVVQGTTVIRVCLGDFGNSKATLNGEYSISGSVGTHGYIAPELCRDCGAEPQVKIHANNAVDVFSMGLLFHFTQTVGYHPFGEEMLRHVNIVNKENPSFGRLSESDFTLQSLIESMICYDPKRRPNMKDVVGHPALWCAKRTLTYYQQSSDQMEALIKKNKMDDEPMKDTYLIPHGNWKKNLPDIIQDDIKTSKVCNGLMYAGKANSPRWYAVTERKIVVN